MAVINVTPDSFSDGGRLASPQAVVDAAGAMIAAGADVLDVGGESTRPGAPAVPAEMELERVLPALAALRSAFPEIALSIDSYKPSVARAAIQAGADIINDVWGLTGELPPEERSAIRDAIQTNAARTERVIPVTAMAGVAAELRCPVIAMHNRPDRHYRDFWADVTLDLRLSVALAERAGIQPGQLWLDPGFGFAKNPAQNLEVLRDLRRIVDLGFPVLLGTSRKSTIGLVLGGEVSDRLEGTAATIVWGIQQGCQMVRVHDVSHLVRFVRMADAIKAGLSFKAP